MELYYQDTLHILLAMLIGLIIGAEREYRSKPAGLRTLMLVSVGACLFTILSIKIGVNNPDRIASNIITGIGFLGAGAIFKDNNNISGLTTATSIWICSALGMAVGAGYVYIAFAGSIAVIIVLSLLGFLESYIDDRSRTREYRIVTAYTSKTLLEYEELFKENGLQVKRGAQTIATAVITGNWKLTGSKQSHKKLLDILLQDAAVKELDF